MRTRPAECRGCLKRRRNVKMLLGCAQVSRRSRVTGGGVVEMVDRGNHVYLRVESISPPGARSLSYVFSCLIVECVSYQALSLLFSCT